MESKFCGCLVGLAVGDALGTTLEFFEPGSFETITDMVGGGPFELKPGQWTDDTSMALCLAESIIETQGFNLEDQIKRYLRWFDEGYLSSTGELFDIGETTELAFYNYMKNKDPKAGSTHPRSAGNGSIMRLAPVPMAYANNPEKGLLKADESSLTTHALKVCRDACKYFSGLIIGALNGVAKEELLSTAYRPGQGQWAQKDLVSEIFDIAAGSFKQKEPPEIIGSGYVVKSLEAALWAFYKSSSFVEGALKAVNLGDDADTTGAVYGQLAGAYYGIDEIPKKWQEQITYSEMIKEYAKKLYHLSNSLAK